MNAMLFVYGSLRRAYAHPMHVHIASHTGYVGNGRFNGQLYLVNWYPGAVPSDDPSEWVTGELYQVNNPAVFAILDEFEGCYAKPPEFIRTFVPVITEDNLVHLAYVYAYNGRTHGLARITSGDFLQGLRRGNLQ